MYSISRFQQIIKPVMNGHFARHVRKHQADKHSKGFGCQNLLLCLLYARLGRCASCAHPGSPLTPTAATITTEYAQHPPLHIVQKRWPNATPARLPTCLLS